MKSINEYINEARHSFKIGHLKHQYKHYPKTKEELIDFIVDEIRSENYNLNCIDTSKITDMKELFMDVIAHFNYVLKKIDISEWDVSNVTTMESMFNGCDTLESIGDVSNWNTSKVESIESMFNMCEKIEVDVSNWDVSNVEFASYTFVDCNHFNCDLSKWKVSKFLDISFMFYGCYKFTGKGLENWDIKLKEKQWMLQTFDGCKFKTPKWYIN